MQFNRKGARKQRGFTLVEMSVTMAAAGLLFAAVSTGQELVEQAKANKLLNEVKTLEAQLQQFNTLKGRFPGDCDGNGRMDYAADTNADATSSRTEPNQSARATQYAYSMAQLTIPADGEDSLLETDTCALVAKVDDDVTTSVQTVAATNANVWLNDLKHAGLVPESIPNRKLARLAHEDYVFVGKVVDNGSENADTAAHNAIVIHNVPQWMARRLATAINGQDARADRGRVRALAPTGADGTYTQRWQDLQAGTDDTKATRDGTLTVVYFFDRVPESKKVADAS